MKIESSVKNEKHEQKRRICVFSYLSPMIISTYTRKPICKRITGANGIRLDHVEVPAVVAVGETAHLSCDVDQQSDQIYSIKWYKDSDEFYEVNLNISFFFLSVSSAFNGK
jgi:hypothetical protein